MPFPFYFNFIKVSFHLQLSLACLVSSDLLLLSFLSVRSPFHSCKDDVLGGVLKPTVASLSQSMTLGAQQPGKLVSDDLDSSLANLVGSMY